MFNTIRDYVSFVDSRYIAVLGAIDVSIPLGSAVVVSTDWPAWTPTVVVTAVFVLTRVLLPKGSTSSMGDWSRRHRSPLSVTRLLTSSSA